MTEGIMLVIAAGCGLFATSLGGPGVGVIVFFLVFLLG